MLLGLTIKLSLAVHKDITKWGTTVLDAQPQLSLIPLTMHANPALKAISTTQWLKDAFAPFHVLSQDQLIQPPTNAFAQLTQKELKESGIQDVKNANAHPIFPYGTESIVWYVLQTPPSIQRKDNATTVQKDSSEITPAINVFQDWLQIHHENDQIYWRIANYFLIN